MLSPGGIVPDKLSFVVRVLPLALLGRWGIRRTNRMIFAGQPVPAEIEEAMTVIRTHFKMRLGVLPIFSDAELRRLRMPVQLVIGARDPLRDAEKIAARMRQRVPQLSATIVPDAGHALMNSTMHVLPFLEAVSHEPVR